MSGPLDLDYLIPGLADFADKSDCSGARWEKRRDSGRMAMMRKGFSVMLGARVFLLIAEKTAMRVPFLSVGLAFFGLLASARGGPEIAVPNYKHLDGQKLVFIVNGAGGGSTVSDRICDLTAEMHLPLRIHTIHWCRGDRALQDYKDRAAQWQAAFRLAEATTLIRRDCPRAENLFCRLEHRLRHCAECRRDAAGPERGPHRLDRRPGQLDARSAAGIAHEPGGDRQFLEPGRRSARPRRPELGDDGRGQRSRRGRVGFWYPRWTDAERSTPTATSVNTDGGPAWRGTAATSPGTSKPTCTYFVVPLFLESLPPREIMPTAK